MGWLLYYRTLTNEIIMTYFAKAPLLLLTIILASCGGYSKKEPPKEDWQIRHEKRKQLDTLNKNEAGNLSQQHNAIIGWDTLTEYTYQLQDLIATDSRLSFTGDITDIIKKDSNYVLRVIGSYIYSHAFSNRTYLAEILVSPSKFREINILLADKKHSNEACFIFNCNKVISSSKLALDSEVSGSETEGDLSSYLTYDFDETLVILQGEIIDYYVYKKLEKK